MRKIFKWSFLFIGLCALLTACSNKGESYYQSALDKYEDEKFEEAIKDCNKAISEGVKGETLGKVYWIKGTSYMDLESYDDAIKYLEKAVKTNKNDYKAWTNLGICYRMNENYEKAIESYNTAIGIEPDYAEVHSSLGSLYILNNEPEKAIEKFEKAISIDSSISVTHGNMAYALAMVGRFEDAEKALDKARSLGYENADTIQKKIEELKGE